MASRECGILATTPIYLFCMVIFPIITILFFTFLLDSGQPQEMPIGVVDLDKTSTTRALIRRLDGMQNCPWCGTGTSLELRIDGEQIPGRDWIWLPNIIRRAGRRGTRA